MTSPHAASNIREASSFPDNWDIATISELFKFSSGKARPKEIAETRSDSKPYPVYGGNGVMGFAADHLTGKPSLIIGRVGVYCGCAHHTDGPAWISDNALYAKWVSERIDTRWARYFFEYANLNQYSSRAAQPLVSQGMLSGIRMPVPPKTEQRQIAQVLSAVLQAIERQERLIALTAELKRAVMHKVFTEGTRGDPLKQTEIGPVPKSWAESRLGNIARFSSGGTPSREVSEYWVRGTIPWVKTAEIDYCTITATEERITQAGLDNSSAKVLPAGTLLMAMYGQGITRGRVAILGIDAAANQACAAITPHSENEVSTGFLYHFLEFHYEALRQRGHGANQTNLSMTLLKQFPVCYPKRDEQDTVVQALRTVDAKVNIHEKNRMALNSLFRALLHQLMTAQARVHDLDLSPLDELAAENGGGHVNGK